MNNCLIPMCYPPPPGTGPESPQTPARRGWGLPAGGGAPQGRESGQDFRFFSLYINRLIYFFGLGPGSAVL